MILLDENIPENQRQILRSRRIQAKQIGVDFAKKGMKDDQIVRYLLKLNNPTFFTRDLGFYLLTNCNNPYCIVCLAVDKNETAYFIRRLLRHPKMNTKRKRMGTVAWVSHSGIAFWHTHSTEERNIAWQD